MIQGIGVDICDLTRLDIDNQRFIHRILSLKEREIFDSKKTDQQKREFLGGRFAVKEAFIKAYGQVSFQDISCLNDDLGKPFLNYENTHVSISHEHNYVVAFVIVEK